MDIAREVVELDGKPTTRNELSSPEVGTVTTEMLAQRLARFSQPVMRSKGASRSLGRIRVDDVSSQAP